MDKQDNRQSMDEKVTISLAAKALKVSTKTVHRYIEKGLLTKSKEGTRVYVQMDDIRTLLSGQVSMDKSPRVHENDKVTVDRGHYDSLLVRLGQLEANQQLLLEYKEGLQAKDRELEAVKSALAANNAELAEARATISKARGELERFFDTQSELKDLRVEIERLRLPWYKRIFFRR